MFDDRRREHQKAGRTKSALKRVMFNKRFLEGVHLPIRCEPLNSSNFAPFRLYGEHEASAHRLIIKKDCARAAYPVLTSDVRAGESAFLSDHINECLSGRNPHVVRPVVYRQCEFSHVMTLRLERCGKAQGWRRVRGNVLRDFLGIPLLCSMRPHNRAGLIFVSLTTFGPTLGSTATNYGSGLNS